MLSDFRCSNLTSYKITLNSSITLLPFRRFIYFSMHDLSQTGTLTSSIKHLSFISFIYLLTIKVIADLVEGARRSKVLEERLREATLSRTDKPEKALGRSELPVSYLSRLYGDL
jgi:hypothetical protein